MNDFNLNHVRLRAGMYIGRLNSASGTNKSDGIYNLFRAILNYASEEFLLGYGKLIDITVTDSSFRIRDYGRGIPYSELVYMVSGGDFPYVNGKLKDYGRIPRSVVCAISSDFRIESNNGNCCSYAHFKYGSIMECENKEQIGNWTGTCIEFTPDTAIIGNYELDYSIIQEIVQTYSYLHRGLTYVLNGQEYLKPNGMLDLVNDKVGKECLYPPVYLADGWLEIAFTHRKEGKGDILSFVNGQPTPSGGTHQKALEKCLTRMVCMNEFKRGRLFFGLFAVVSLRIENPYGYPAIIEELYSQDVNEENGPSIEEYISTCMRGIPQDVIDTLEGIASRRIPIQDSATELS